MIYDPAEHPDAGFFTFLRAPGYTIREPRRTCVSYIGVILVRDRRVARNSGARRYLLERRSSRRDGYPGLPESYRTKLVALLVLATLMLFVVSCGEDQAGGGETPEQASGEAAPGEVPGEATLTPAEATVSPNEDTAMPAAGIDEAPSQAPPENPPEGVRTYPATTNRNLSESITYDQDPPTNGDHAPYWQNCGFYSSPVENEAAVHSLDHGAIWITYQPDLPAGQVDTLRDLAREEYVLVSPYPGLSSPVIAIAWRNQLALKDADDPRLRQFVDQFRVSETAPRSGNGCTGGRGEPET